jgi:hypothetical protein
MTGQLHRSKKWARKTVPGRYSGLGEMVSSTTADAFIGA